MSVIERAPLYEGHVSPWGWAWSRGKGLMGDMLGPPRPVFGRVSTPATLADLLRGRAHYQPERPAYTFLTDGETHEIMWTYEVLDGKVRTIAALLQKMGLGGERALLLYPPGLEYLCTLMSPLAFLQCPMRRLQAISRIAAPRIISGRPNFAYDLCVRKIAAEQRESQPHMNQRALFCANT